MGKLIVYGALASPPVRSVVLTVRELGLDFELRTVDLTNGEHKTEEYLKKNPQHTIPMLEDDGQYIWDSHAIIAYLVRKYGKTDALYPKDFYVRAIVDQRLHFDSGVLFTKALKQFLRPDVSKEEKVAPVVEAYGFLEAFLQDKYLAGDHLTIADFSLLPTTSTLNMVLPVDSAKTPKLSAWLELMKELPYYEEVNGKGLELVSGIIKERLAAAGIEM